MVDSPFKFFTNLIGLFGSSTKGLFVFAPPLLLSLFAIPLAFRLHRDVAVFVLLATGCTAVFIATLITTADELWGPRFMHVTVAPLLLIIGAAWPRFEWRRHAALLVSAVIGLSISFLGAFYYYGARDGAADDAHQNTLEWFAGDSVWNEIAFDARLFQVWWKGGTEPVLWTPTHIWVWTPPPGSAPWPTLNLRKYSDPQSFLLQYWKASLQGDALLLMRVCFVSLIVGPLLLVWVVVRTLKGRREPMVREVAIAATATRNP